MSSSKGLKNPEKAAPFKASRSWSGNERDRTFLNDGASFVDISTVSGLSDAADGRSMSYLDFDRDGKIDILATNMGAPALRLYRSQIDSSNQFIAVKLNGGSQQAVAQETWSNRSGIGSKVILKLSNDVTLVRELRLGEGLGTQNDSVLYLGIPAGAEAMELSINWPSGRISKLEKPNANKLYRVFENPSHSSTGSAFVGEPLHKAKLKDEKLKSPKTDLPYSKSSKLTVLTAMATWCSSCKSEIPQIASAYNGLPADSVEWLGFPIDPEDKEAKLQRYKEDFNPPYSIIQNPSTAQRESFKAFLKKGLSREILPSSIILDSDGRILSVMKGTPTRSDLLKLLSNPQATELVLREILLPDPGTDLTAYKRINGEILKDIQKFKYRKDSEEPTASLTRLKETTNNKKQN